jgi:hypothetical protein
LVGNLGDLAAFVTTAAALLAPAAAGIEGRVRASWGQLWWLRFRLALAGRRPESYFSHYARLWECAIRYGAFEFVGDHVAAERVSALPYDLGTADDRLVGFHGIERNGDVSFRWSEPLALVQLALEPRDYTVTLRLAHPARRGLETLAVFFDGRPLLHDVEATKPPSIVLRIPRERVRRRHYHEIVWVCARHPVDPRAETRALGLPIAAIEVAAAAVQPLPSSSSR